jgi:hypothetical protein
MLENQLILRAGFQQHGELVKALDAPRQLRAVKQIDRRAVFKKAS